MSTPQETISKFERVAIPCESCGNKLICKYSDRCNNYASNINKEIDSINAFLELSASASANDLFTITMNTTTELPIVNLSCIHYEEAPPVEPAE